jgi:hypothetical protein
MDLSGRIDPFIDGFRRRHGSEAGHQQSNQDLVQHLDLYFTPTRSLAFPSPETFDRRHIGPRVHYLSRRVRFPTTFRRPFGVASAGAGLLENQHVTILP